VRKGQISDLPPLKVLPEPVLRQTSEEMSDL
jgi:hypothetical protein